MIPLESTQTGKSAVVTATVLNVRSGPSTEQPKIAQLTRGTAVEILEVAGRWYAIRSGVVRGYVHGDFVTILDTNPARGFLKELEELLSVSMEPPESRKIALVQGFGARERLVARTWNEQGGLLQALSDIVRIPVSTAVAVVCVESGGKAYSSDGRMIIRFENHVFWRTWGKYNEGEFRRHFRFDAQKPWLGHEFRKRTNTAFAPFHGRQEKEWEVLEFAGGLQEPAAKQSISMGVAQIMGFNFAKVGYEAVGEMFDAFESGIRFQVLGFFDFVKGSGTTSAMLQALERRKFADFAAGYNGPGNAAEYGERIERNVEVFEILGRNG